MRLHSYCCFILLAVPLPDYGLRYLVVVLPAAFLIRRLLVLVISLQFVLSQRACSIDDFGVWISLKELVRQILGVRPPLQAQKCARLKTLDRPLKFLMRYAQFRKWFLVPSVALSPPMFALHNHAPSSVFAVVDVPGRRLEVEASTRLGRTSYPCLCASYRS